jgi:hypothetical protein
MYAGFAGWMWLVGGYDVYAGTLSILDDYAGYASYLGYPAGYALLLVLLQAGYVGDYPGSISWLAKLIFCGCNSCYGGNRCWLQ